MSKIIGSSITVMEPSGSFMSMTSRTMYHVDQGPQEVYEAFSGTIPAGMLKFTQDGEPLYLSPNMKPHAIEPRFEIKLAMSDA